MKTFARCLPALLLAAFLSSPILADDVKKEEPKKPDVKKEEPKKTDVKKEDKKPEPYAQVFSFPKTITLDDKQTKALADIKKEYIPKLEELDKKASVIVTPERTKAAAEARKKAMDDGKKGKELADAAREAMKLSADESKTLGEINTARGKLRQEINGKKTELLTEEQKKLIQPKPKTAK